MRRLAFAQIAWSIAYQWDSSPAVDGPSGVPRAGWPRGGRLLLTLRCARAVWLLRRACSALRLCLRGRDSPLRAGAVGIDVQRIQWARSRSGAFAGLAGGLFAFSKGSISPHFHPGGLALDRTRW